MKAIEFRADDPRIPPFGTLVPPVESMRRDWGFVCVARGVFETKGRGAEESGTGTLTITWSVA